MSTAGNNVPFSAAQFMVGATIGSLGGYMGMTVCERSLRFSRTCLHGLISCRLPLY
jgi:Na+/H+-translocating membrane pyrophosphatase